jgi:hypothetical protein
MRTLVDELRTRRGTGPAVDLQRAIHDQDELDFLCGPDPAPARLVDAPPLTARELVTSPVAARVRP